VSPSTHFIQPSIRLSRAPAACPHSSRRPCQTESPTPEEYPYTSTLRPASSPFHPHKLLFPHVLWVMAASGGQWGHVIIKTAHTSRPQRAPKCIANLFENLRKHHLKGNMSLTIFTRPFTLSTYDPPSTPIALAAQDTGQTPTHWTANEQGHRLGGEAPKTRASIVGASEVWGRLKNTQATPPVKNKSERGADVAFQSILRIVLPWVAGVQKVAEDWIAPEGMFGPYPSSMQCFE